MEPYSIEFRRAASKEMEDLPMQVGRRIAAAIDTLALDPRRQGSMKLRQATNGYRLRVGSYRILYEIDDASRAVWIFAIRHRREAYR